MKIDAFKRIQKVNIHLDYFCTKNRHPKLSKTAQSGHTERVPDFEIKREREIGREMKRGIRERTMNVGKR